MKMEFKKKEIIITIIAIIAIIFLVYRTNLDSGEIDFFPCDIDNDCTSVANGVCGCTAGGSNIAINEKYISEWAAQFDSQQIACLTVMSNHWTCFAQPICIQNKCELIPSSPPPQPNI